MKFEGDLYLNEKNVCQNKSKRSTFKLLSNSMLGKFSQRTQFPETVFVCSQAEIEEIYQKTEMADILGITDNICEIQILPDKETNSPNRSGNCIIGAFVTAYARTQLHKDMALLKRSGFSLCYVDTDGIIFSGPKSHSLPLSVSPCLGDYKHELGNGNQIKSFACIAKKTYCISYLNNKTQKEEYSIKCSGLSLSSAISAQNLSPKEFEKMLFEFARNEKSGFQIPQLRKYVVQKDTTVNSRITNVKLSNTLDIQRIVEAIDQPTYPYGFRKNK